MARGRLPLPQQVKDLRGTARPGRPRGKTLNAPLSRVPPVPPWVSKDQIAREKWKRDASRLVAMRILTDLHLDALAILCMLGSAIRREFDAKRIPPPALVTQWRGLNAEFGMSPIAEQRLNQRDTDEDDPFARLAADT